MASFTILPLETQQQVFSYLDRQLLRSLRLISHDWCAALAHSIEHKSYELSPEIAPIGTHFILNNHPVAICHYRDDLLPHKMTFDIWKAYFTGPKHYDRPFSKPTLSKAVFHIQTPEDVTWKAHRVSFELESDEGGSLTVGDVLQGVSDCLWSNAFAVWEHDIVKWDGFIPFQRKIKAGHLAAFTIPCPLFDGLEWMGGDHFRVKLRKRYAKPLSPRSS